MIFVMFSQKQVIYSACIQVEIMYGIIAGVEIMGANLELCLQQ